MVFFYSIDLQAYAPAEGNISSYFGPYLFKSVFESSKTSQDSFATGIGLVVLGDVNEKGSIEIGMFHFHKVYFREESGKLIAEKTPLMHITMGYRRWFDESFSGSITLSSAYSMGSVERVYSDFAAGSEIPTSATDNTEYGFDFSLVKELYQKDKIQIFCDLRYSLSLTSKAGESADQYSAMIALNYLLQNKNGD